MQVPWHWSVKFPLILCISAALLFWSYEKFVRYSFIGTALNGPRQRKSTVMVTATSINPGNQTCIESVGRLARDK